MSKGRTIAILLLVIGIVLFIVGTQIDSGYESRSYHKVYKDWTGTWQGKDVSYMAEKTNGCEKIGLVLAIAGGIGMSITKKQ